MMNHQVALQSTIFDGEGVRVTFPRGGRSEIDPAIIFSSFDVMSVSRESSDRLLEGSRRMFCNQPVFRVDSPGSVQELPDFNLCLCIGASLRTRRNIENQSSQSNRIIVAHRRGITKADDSIQVQMLRDLSPGFLGFSGTDGKATVEGF